VSKIPRKHKQYDLYIFVAGAALEKGEPFQIYCNCGGVVTIMPPFQSLTLRVTRRQHVRDAFLKL